MLPAVQGALSGRAALSILWLLGLVAAIRYGERRNGGAVVSPPPPPPAARPQKIVFPAFALLLILRPAGAQPDLKFFSLIMDCLR